MAIITIPGGDNELSSSRVKDQGGVGSGVAVIEPDEGPFHHIFFKIYIKKKVCLLNVYSFLS